MGNRITRLKGVRYIRCEHLVKGTQDVENASIWFGDNFRVIACPICLKTHLGHTIDFLNQLYMAGIEYYKNLDQHEREEVYKQLFKAKE